MEQLINAKSFQQVKYVVMGKERQILSVVLAPAQTIYADESKMVCCGDGLVRSHVSKPIFRDPVEYALI